MSETNAQKIAAWQAEHPGERPTEAALLTCLGLTTLRYADLWYANLQSADLRYADLQSANLQSANLWYANLQSANLQSAVWSGLRIDGLPSGQVTLIPTPDGWDLRVGCWHGTPDDLRALVAQDDDWPEATGEEIVRRRPLLLAALALIDAHTADRADVIIALAEKWSGR